MHQYNKVTNIDWL